MDEKEARKKNSKRLSVERCVSARGKWRMSLSSLQTKLLPAVALVFFHKGGECDHRCAGENEGRNRRPALSGCSGQRTHVYQHVPPPSPYSSTVTQKVAKLEKNADFRRILSVAGFRRPRAITFLNRETR